MTARQGWELQASISRPGQPALVEAYRRSQISIGGLPDNTIVLSDPFVSGRHARVMVSDGKVIYQDCSRNGSFVDGVRIDKRELAAEDVVSIPPFELRFELIVFDEIRQTQARDTYKIPKPEVFDPPIAMPVAVAGIERQVTVAAPSAVQSSALLRVLRPEAWAGREHALGSGSVRIGRGEGMQLQFDLLTLSRQHATLRHDGEAWVVEDHESANGTFVRGRQVTRSRLVPGDEIAFGPDLVVALVALEATDPPRVDETEPRDSTDVPVVETEAERVAGAPFILRLKIRGRVDGYNYTKLADQLDRVIDARERFLIIDLGGLEFIDHTGLGALVDAATRLDRARGHLRLVGVGPRLRDTFELSRLDSLFRGRIAENTASAIRALERLR